MLIMSSKRQASQPNSILANLKLIHTSNTHQTNINKPQKAKIYVNKTLAGEVELTTELSTQTISLLIPLHAGVNTVHIILPNAYQPIQVEPGNMDESYLAAKYEWLKLERLP